MSKSLYDQMKAILDEVQEVSDDAKKKSAKKAATETRKILKATSPRARRGKYAAGWAIKDMSDGILTTFVVYNKKLPGFTQLLEKGHVIRNKKGEWGRAPAHKHIAPAEDQGGDIMLETAMEELDKL